MDRINIQCQIDGQPTNLQLDKKAMPGENGPCFMITADGCFKGYVSCQKDGTFKFIGPEYYTSQHLQMIAELIRA
jgi:hypothetical protein